MSTNGEVRELRPRQQQSPEAKAATDALGRFWWWLFSRISFGPFLVMHMAGMLHLNVNHNIPALGLIQSCYVTMALVLLGFFLRRA